MTHVVQITLTDDEVVELHAALADIHASTTTLSAALTECVSSLAKVLKHPNQLF